MRKLLFAALLISVLTSCKKLPDTGRLSNEFVVLTNYDTKADFTSYKTFSLPPYVGAITDNPKDSILDPVIGNQLIQKVEENLTARGYTKVPRENNPDLGISITAIKNISIYSVWYPGGWWGYGGWGGCYWYYCGYYPIYPPGYPVYYVYETGSVIVEMLDLKNASHEEDKLNVLWTNWDGGALGATSDNVTNALNSIDQGFIQSPYIGAN